MLLTITCALLIVLPALVIGQATLALCGAQRWSWLAPAVGISVMMLITAPALHLPGRSMTTAVVLCLAAIAALAFVAMRPAHRPPLTGLLAGLPVFLLALVPFAAAGRSGILGVSFNNDMVSHLLWADAYRSEAISAINPVAPSYPLGPHSLVASLAEGLGVGVDIVFAGLTIASPVLLGWAALGALRSSRGWGPFVAAPLVGMTFLIAGYYGQGAFKEVLQAQFVLSIAIALAFPLQTGGGRRWVPLALLLAGVLSVYSHLGLVWPLTFIGLWTLGVVAARMRATRSIGAVATRVRAELAPVLLGLGVLILVVAPQLDRIARFASDASGTNGTGIPTEDVGNLVGRLPVWEAFGIWNSADFRFTGPDQTRLKAWVLFMVGLTVIGAVWSLRRSEWMLPAAAAATLLIWQVSESTQSPYVAAKALLLLAPLTMILAVRLLAERDTVHRRMPSWWTVAAPVLAALVVVKVIGSSWDALTFSKVGPTAHAREIQSLGPLIDGRPTLYLGNDDFTRWLFADAPVFSPVIAVPSMGLRPEKPWAYGRNYDIDSLDSATLNQFDWVVTPRDAAASALPSELKLVRSTPSFGIYRRTAEIPARQVLAEGEASAARLDCGTPEGREIVRKGGVAAIRDGLVSVSAPLVAPGGAAIVALPLTRGEWDLVTPYTSAQPVRVATSGLRTVLPANLERPGPRWPIGRITVRRTGPVAVEFQPAREFVTPDSAVTALASVTAVPVGTERVVPIASACGKLVDWYRPASS